MRLPLCVLSLLLVSVSSVRADDLDELLKRVPPYMNTVVVYRVDSIIKSPRALKEDWAKKHQMEYMAGASSIPSTAGVAVVAAHINVEKLSDAATIGMIPINFAVDMNQLAAREHGSVQLLGGEPSILSPRRGYIMNLNNKVLATSSTFDRQDLGRWVRFASTNKSPVLAKYLQEAVTTHKNDHIILALDMQDMFDSQAVKIEVIASNVAQGSGYVVENFTKFLYGIRGLRISINFDDKTTAAFSIDFSGKATDWEKQLPVFLPRFVDELGAGLDELKTAKMEFQDNSVVLKTEISDASLRRILSLVSAPSAGSPQSMGSKEPTPKETADLTATLRYYKSVSQVIDDLGRYKNTKQTDYNNSALWYESFANKIDKLSIQGVDSEMQQFAASVSNKLRGLAGSLRGLRLQLDAYEGYKSALSVGSGGYGWRSYGGGSVALDSNVGTIRTKQADLAAKAAPEREKVWNIIEEDRSTVRRSMSEKYKIDFNQFK